MYIPYSIGSVSLENTDYTSDIEGKYLPENITAVQIPGHESFFQIRGHNLNSKCKVKLYNFHTFKE